MPIRRRACIVRRARRARRALARVRLVRRRGHAHDVLRPDRADPQPGRQALRGRLGLQGQDALRRQPVARGDDHRGGQELARRPLLRAGRRLAGRRREAGPAAQAAGRHPREGPRALPVRGGHWVGTTGRSRVIAYGPNVKRVRAARLAAGAHRREVEGPRRLGADATRRMQGYITALRLVEGEDVAQQVARGHGRQRRPGLRLEHPDPRRDRQGRDRPRPDQPLLRRRGAGRGSRLPGQGPLPAEGPRLARQHRGRRRPRVVATTRSRRSRSSARCSPTRRRSTSPTARRSTRSSRASSRRRSSRRSTRSRRRTSTSPSSATCRAR